MKSFIVSLLDNTKRCGECKEPLLEQALGVDGALVGKALYEGRIRLKEASWRS